MICTYAQIEAFDKIMARCGKAACCLPSSTPTALILDQRAAANMGVQSLMVDYLQQVTAGLTRALTDDGTLGTATRDLLTAQHTRAGGHQVFSLQGYQRDGQLAKGTQHYNLLRQVCIMADADIELQGPGMQLELSCSTLMTALKLAAPEVPGKSNNSFNKS